MSSKRPVVLITGASAGIGLCLAKELRRRNYHLILTAREGSLARFADLGFEESEHIWLRPLDVKSDKERIKLVREINKKLDGVDILINNAGVAVRSVVEHVRTDERLRQMQTNFLGPMALVRLVLPKMREKRAGRIVNVSSVGGMMAMPTMAVYSASKFALEGATESLYYEVKPWNVKVSLVQPGFINSSSFHNTRFTQQSNESAHNPDEPYYEHYHHMGPFIEKLMKLSPSTSAGVARTIVKTIERSHPPLRVPATPDAIFFDLLRRFLPRRVYHLVLYYSLPGVRKWGRS